MIGYFEKRIFNYAKLNWRAYNKLYCTLRARNSNYSHTNTYMHSVNLIRMTIMTSAELLPRCFVAYLAFDHNKVLPSYLMKKLDVIYLSRHLL